MKRILGISLSLALACSGFFGFGCVGLEEGSEDATEELASSGQAAESAAGFAGLGGSGVSCGGIPAPSITDTTCPSCLVDRCGGAINGYLGTNAQSFGGSCGGYMSCACGCTTPECMKTCAPKYDETCQHAERAIFECMKSSCSDECLPRRRQSGSSGPQREEPTPEGN